MAGIEKISSIQARIIDKYEQLKETGDLIEEPPAKQQIIEKIANYMLVHSNISTNNLDRELDKLNFKSVQQQVCTDAIQTYGNQVEKNIASGQSVYFWVPEEEKDAHGFKINKSLPAILLLKSILKPLAKYVYDSLTKRQQEALEIREFSVPPREHDIFKSRHLPYFINESIYFRQLNELEGAKREKLKSRAEKSLLLIWNGFGNAKLEWYYDRIFRLLSLRAENNRPVIFTSDWNFNVFAELGYKTNPDKLKKKGGRIASRVAGIVKQMNYKIASKD